jgi:hypothetical protein
MEFVVDYTDTTRILLTQNVMGNADPHRETLPEYGTACALSIVLNPKHRQLQILSNIASTKVQILIERTAEFNLLGASQ